MITRRYKNRCYIEMGYNFKFHQEIYWEFLTEVIKCFTNGNKKVLFEMVEWDKNLEEDTKELLYENCCMWRLDNHDEEFQRFVKERIDFITNDWYFPREHELGFDKREGYVRTLWVNIEEAQDQIYWLKNKGDWFTCLIVDKDKDAEDYTYYLKYDELEPDPTMLLEIFSKEKEIEDDILNNIKKLLEEHIKDR